MTYLAYILFLCTPMVSSVFYAVHFYHLYIKGCLCRWAEQHCRLEKLNIQAVVSAMTHRDEFVKEFFIDHDKVVKNSGFGILQNTYCL